MYACKNVEIRTRLFKGINEMVRHVGTNASLSVYPPARNHDNQHYYNQLIKETRVRT